MKHPLLPLILIIASLFALAGANPASTMHGKMQFWFEDNNLRQAGGYPPDFEQMFREPEHWSRLRSLIDVYYLRGNTLMNLCEDLGEDFVRDHFVKVLNDAGITIAIDNLSSWEKTIPMLKEFGANVSAISLQSTLSKGVNARTKNVDQVLGERIMKVVQEVGAVHRAYPDLRIGIIDALPTKGVQYNNAFRRMVDELATEGLELAYIHLDCPVDIPQQGETIDWQGVSEVGRFVQEELGIEFGFICTSNEGGMASDRLFYEKVMKIPEVYPFEGRLPDHFIMMSWYPHPSRSLPEDAPEGSYPMTKTALHLVSGLRKAIHQFENGKK